MTIYHSIEKEAVNKLHLKKYFIHFLKQNPQFSLNQALHTFLGFAQELSADTQHPEFIQACLSA